MSFEAGQIELLYNRRFYEDFAGLGPEPSKKVLATLSLVRNEGPYHPSLLNQEDCW